MMKIKPSNLSVIWMLVITLFTYLLLEALSTDLMDKLINDSLASRSITSVTAINLIIWTFTIALCDSFASTILIVYRRKTNNSLLLAIVLSFIVLYLSALFTLLEKKINLQVALLLSQFMIYVIPDLKGYLLVYSIIFIASFYLMNLVIHNE